MILPRGAGHPRLTLGSSGDPTRVVVSEADPELRAAMADCLRAVGYEVVEIDQLGKHLPPGMEADFAVVRCVAGEIGLVEGEPSDTASRRLAIGWLRPRWFHAARPAAPEAQRDEHVVRIFSAVAPLFINIDRERADRLARGLHALRSTIWAAAVPAAANGDCAPSAPNRPD